MAAFLGLIPLLLPLITEIIKLLFAAPSDKRADIAKEINQKLSEIRAAIKKSQDTGGDTSDIEKVINGKP